MNTIAMPLVRVSQAERGASDDSIEVNRDFPAHLIEPQSEIELAEAVYTLVYALTAPAPEGYDFP